MSEITTYLCGGLGNQMFQYAAGRALALRCRSELLLNIAWYSAPQIGATPRRFGLEVFPAICGRQVLYPWPRPEGLWSRLLRRARFKLPCAVRGYVPEPSFNYWPGITRVQAPAQLVGFWQTERYFAHHAAQIRADFSFPEFPHDAGRALGEKIAAENNAISVHVRMGDYVNSQASAMHNVVTPRYYERAFQFFYNMYGTCKIFVFSDEPEKASSFLDAHGHDLTIVDMKSGAHHDMHLMSLCTHHIIANSSFSWWGAWLGKKEGVTIAPARWFSDSQVNTEDVCPPAWLRMEP